MQKKKFNFEILNHFILILTIYSYFTVVLTELRNNNQKQNEYFLMIYSIIAKYYLEVLTKTVKTTYHPAKLLPESTFSTSL